MAVIVPEAITVHLGTPSSNARNITIPFTDYIKNVASSEIYPTWPESAIRANIIAQISLALNRVYTEFYRTQGYSFDITNSTQFDQAFDPDREYFSNISRIVDEIFNTYVVVRGTVQPYFTEYCDGVRVYCRGLSQWGTVNLANRGLTPYEILQYYYGENIDLRRAQTGPNVQSYPGTPLRLGSVGEEVRTIQQQLNRIARNYPLIPRIPQTDGFYRQSTVNAVRTFQSIFNLTQDGVVGRSTWYAIKRIYNAVRRLSELFSEGITITEAQRQFPEVLRRGDTGSSVRIIQYFINFIAFFNNNIPRVTADGVFGAQTEQAVRAFQSLNSLPVTGVINRTTWDSLIREYSRIVNSLPSEYRQYSSLIYPGFFLTIGTTGAAVEQIQTALNVISNNIQAVPSVTVDGVYGAQTANAVRVVQRLYGLPVNGDVGPLTWNAIIELYRGYIGN